MAKRKIYFRADASATIGYGHFIRSLALADMLKDEFDCTFFTTSPTAYQMEEMEKVCAFTILREESKFEEFLDYLSGDEIVVLDNYFYTSDYMTKIKECGCILVHIDDIHNRYFNADIIINHGNATVSDYDANSNTLFCLGPSYALLRKPFLFPRVTESRKNKWVICFGGSDQYNLTAQAAHSISDKAEEIVAIVGAGYTQHSSLASIANLEVLTNLSAEQMADEFSTAENVICSASSVCYEALACGCNIYAGYYVDNQKEFYEGLVKHNFITPLGNLFDVEFSKLLFKSDGSLRRLDFSRARRNLLNAFRTLDFRVVNYIDMTIDESHGVWEIRNLPEIRKCMTHPEQFPFESHLSFVESLRGNKSKLYYAIFWGDELIGSYDFVDIKDGDTAEHGLYLNPKFFRKGYGMVLESLMDSYIRQRGVRRVLAEVLKNNLQSYHYHLKAGYKVYDEDSKYYYLERKLQ